MEKMSVNLQSLLADSYIIMLKTQNFHWNVTGPNFASLHIMFETQYKELFLAVDEIAERIRSLGFRAPASYAEFNSLSEIRDSKESHANEMVVELTQSHRQLVKTAKALIKDAERLNDNATSDMAIKRVQVHEKYLWMLEAMLK